jgi:transcription-repair coupling factor (superfamily II helicase)
LKQKSLLEILTKHPCLEEFKQKLQSKEQANIHLSNMAGSGAALFAAAAFKTQKHTHLIVCSDAETAAYFYNDIENVFEEQNASYEERRIFFYPISNKTPYDTEATDNSNVLFRAEVINRLSSGSRKTLIVTYPEALSEKIVSKQFLKKYAINIYKGDKLSLDFVVEALVEFEFERADFVVEAGQFAVRGGIIDVFSFSNDQPYRIVFFGEEIETIKSFAVEDQLTIKNLKSIQILPNIRQLETEEKRVNFLSYMPETTVIWTEDIRYCNEKIDFEYKKAQKIYEEFDSPIKHLPPEELYCKGTDIESKIKKHSVVEYGKKTYLKDPSTIVFQQEAQISFNKSFDMLKEHFNVNQSKNISNYIFSSSRKQIERLQNIFEDLYLQDTKEKKAIFEDINMALSQGFIDKDLNLAFYTDHQIFDRYHRFRLKERFGKKEALSIQEFHNLKPGDFVTHVDHGVGVFDGLEKLEVNGKEQEALRIIYKNKDLLYVSIHSLHRISKFTSKEGSLPRLNKLGSNAWKTLKSKTKKKVKDIARDLIRLYAKRKTSKGFAFMPDTYLQHELEASFFFEDTEDQIKSTRDVKKDMEADYPMDRLICGDVGFGKTEIAIRAAFKAVNDSKQVAVLVPTTILALQHYHTFRNRLKDLPCQVDYINRFKSVKQIRESLENLKKGKTDIIIGTHRLISKDIEFNDLGLFVIDEEQKFGVAAKEKLKRIKVNVDTLTLTATPIPRTLQFSLMGARDLSIISTPPPNRYPIQTEITAFSEELIRDVVTYEVNRGGQVFFVHNRVQNLPDVAAMIEKFCPQVRIAIGHGQMDGNQLERIMMDFIDGHYDVLVSTTIIESGLDIPNANTIIINDAQNYGLSDLHQLRGRVGRTNKKAFCYLLAPPLSTLTQTARQRLKALEEFSTLGSGFNIAMRDLDIRGAGNILGGEQSGFISEIGFEMYQKILDETLQELKETEFKNIFAKQKTKEETGKGTNYTKDCVIESDLQIMIPDSYVLSSNERLKLYKDLDSLSTEKELVEFKEILIDRFGEVPVETEELLNTIRLRNAAKKLGIEKIILRNNKLLASFINNQDAEFWNSPSFTAMLQFVQMNAQNTQLKEEKERLKLRILKITSVKEALRILLTIIEKI